MFRSLCVRGVYAFGWAAGVLAIGGGSTALAAGYYELAPWNTINNGGTSTSQFAHAIDGQTSYHQLTLNGSPRITRIDQLNGTQVASDLVSTADWVAAGGSSTSMSTIYGFSVVGDYVTFAETGTDAIWRADKNTGALTQYASQAAIQAATGQSSVTLLSSYEVLPSGEVVFYEGASDSILITSGANNVSTLVSSAALTTLQGNATVSGGIGLDASGALYWGNNSSDSLYKRANDGTLSQVLSTADITSVTGGSIASFGDIFGAPDGFIYLVEGSSNHILRFDPAEPASTLSIFLSESDLLSGPAGSNNVFQLGWYDGNLSFNVNGAAGLYVVPEPATLTLLACGAVVALRRRRRGGRA